MIEQSTAYQKAIVGDARRMLIKAIIDITSPDIKYGVGYGDSQTQNTKPEQLHDHVLVQTDTPAVTLEKNRWILNQRNTFSPTAEQQIGFEGGVVSDKNGVFNPPVWVTQPFSNVYTMQGFFVCFPNSIYDGVAVDFTGEVLEGGVVRYSKTITGNMEPRVEFRGFTVYYPDAIRITVTKWSLPYRRIRVMELYPGFYEEWDGSMLASLSVKHQGDVSCMSLPYGTCTLRMDNLDRRFEPRSKDGIFQSLEERQGVDVHLGTRLDDGTDEYKRVGVFYQYSGGWKTGDNGITMQWDLVDIVGLLAERQFIPPKTLPTTLEGWAQALVSQFGENFKTLYTVDVNYASKSVTVREYDDIVGQTCGNILLWACMATGTWPRADAETGKLAIEPLWSQGNSVTLDNITQYPIMKANNDLAAVIFTLNDGNNTQVTFSGNNTASSDTQSVSNPFIKTTDEARTVARMILSMYGGNQYELTGRGNPSSEIGDVDTIWLNESIATTARRIQQTFEFSNGVMQGCKSVLMQSDGYALWQGNAVITKSGTWTAPAGVSTIRLILVGKGQDGTPGTDGSWPSYYSDGRGKDGEDGLGGLVWSGIVNVNEQQQFPVTIGENTVFGQLSSANGTRYETGYTDIASGNLYGAPAVRNPPPNSGYGGYRGIGGSPGRKHVVEGNGPGVGGTGYFIEVIDAYPGRATPPSMGAYGCAIIYWDK